MPGPAQLWFGFLGGALAWSAHLLASYPLVPLACEMGTAAPLHVVTAAALLLGVASAAVAGRSLARIPANGEAPQDASLEARVRRARFMGRVGLWSGVFFVFVIAVEGLPALLQHPCLAVG